MRIIFGLGNPGAQYARTRHNVGFETLYLLQDQLGATVPRNTFHGLASQAMLGGEKVLLVWPTTFMNLSGQCVRAVMHYYQIPLEHMLVVYDDVDLPVGRIRVRRGGSPGTHNGMRSIIGELGQQGFPRIRVGIGKPPPEWNLADYVLGRFSPEEEGPIKESIGHAAEAAQQIITSGVAAAMNHFNGL